MSTSIRVSEETKRKLERAKREDETFDELLDRLVAQRYASVHEGAGLWEGTDAAERAREKRAELKRDVGR
jgi:predicted CopG family antitoxin